jgi:DNA-binding NarL/FixJ family response regulator
VAGTPDIDRRLSAASAVTPAPTPLRVRTLVVDDSEAVREGLSRLLEARPYCELVGAVSDPASAVERTRATRPHVVLQDYSMPGVDSLALVRELSACRPQPAVLVLSAFADAQAARQAYQAGAIGWVLKDAEPEELFAALLDAAGVRDTSTAVAGAPDWEAGAPVATVADAPGPEPPASLDARTVRALLRALAGVLGGLTAEDVSMRAVLPTGVALRYLQRMASRHPALVAGVAEGVYGLTPAGRRELERLERRIPAAAHRYATPQSLR